MTSGSTSAPRGAAFDATLVDLAGWTGIGLTATVALTVAASIVLLSGRTFIADREQRPGRTGQTAPLRR